MFRFIGSITRELTSAFVQADDDGRTTVYPWGAMGPGYAANPYAASMLARYVRLNLFAGPLVAVTAAQFGWFMATAAVLGYLWLYARLVCRYARFMEPVESPLSGAILIRRFGPRLEAPLLAANLAVGFLALVMSVVVVLKGAFALGLFCVAVSGLFCAAIVYIAFELRGFEDSGAGSALASGGQMR